jgi:hypothetical protein
MPCVLDVVLAAQQADEGPPLAIQAAKVRENDELDLGLLF